MASHASESSDSKKVDEKALAKFLAPFKATISYVDVAKSITKSVDKKNAKQYSACVTNIGIFFLSKPSKKNKIKLYRYISYFDISHIDFLSKKGLSIFQKKDKGIAGEFLDPIKLVQKLIDGYLIFMSTCLSFKPIPIKRAPVEFNQEMKIADSDENPTLLHYYAACVKYHDKVDPNLTKAIKLYNTSDKHSFTLYKRYATPTSYHTIAQFLIYEPKLKLLVFDGFAPEMAGKILCSVLKHNKSVISVVIKNYTSFNYELIGLNILVRPSIVSWTIHNCFSNEDDFYKFLSQFAYYQGDIQRFTISKFKVTASLAEGIASLLTSSFCFRTLEYLEIMEPEIHYSNEIPTVLQAFLNVTSKLKMLQKLSLLDWQNSPKINVDISESFSFVRTESLRYLKLSNLNLSNIISHTVFPSTLNAIELNSCSFSSASLLNILHAVSSIKIPLILSLMSMKLSDQELTLFKNSSQELPTLTNLVEFDYSNNRIDSQFIPEFCRIFLHRELLYLAINNCFSTNELSSLMKILKHLAKKTSLWGLEYQGGKKNTTLGEEIILVLKKLEKIRSLEHLDISLQNWGGSIGENMINLLEKLPNLKYFAADGANFPDFKTLLSFYSGFFNKPKIVSIYRPVVDLNIIYNNNSASHDQIDSQTLKNFKNKMKFICPFSTRTIRSFYYMRYSDMSKFGDFLSNYPNILNDKQEGDIFGLTSFHIQNVTRKSLLDFEMSEIIGKVSDFQVDCLESPIDEFVVRETPSAFTIPQTLKKFSGKYQPPDKYQPYPIIKSHISPQEVTAKYRGYICNQNQRIFRNLSMVSNLFEKVYEENKTDTFGKNIPITEPPTFVSSEVVKIISQQLESLSVVYDEDSDDTTITYSHETTESTSTALRAFNNSNRNGHRKNNSSSESTPSTLTNLVINQASITQMAPGFFTRIYDSEIVDESEIDASTSETNSKLSNQSPSSDSYSDFSEQSFHAPESETSTEQVVTQQALMNRSCSTNAITKSKKKTKDKKKKKSTSANKSDSTPLKKHSEKSHKSSSKKKKSHSPNASKSSLSEKSHHSNSLQHETEEKGDLDFDNFKEPSYSLRKKYLKMRPSKIPKAPDTATHNYSELVHQPPPNLDNI